MKYKAIITGSNGNCFLFNENLIIDMGIPYNNLKKEVFIEKIKFVLLTHIHSDHFKIETIRKMIVNSKVLFICGDFLSNELLKIGIDKNRVKIVEANKLYKMGSYLISPFNLYHDVENFGYRIIEGGHKHFHATDTITLEGITALNYDTATIECNHCEVRAMELIEQSDLDCEFSHLKGTLKSHLSVQKALKFIKENNIKEFVPVHIGSSTKIEVLQKVTNFNN